MEKYWMDVDTELGEDEFEDEELTREELEDIAQAQFEQARAEWEAAMMEDCWDDRGDWAI